MTDIEKFRSYRERMNKKILDSGNIDLQRFFALDSAVYRKGALDEKSKELMGLVASSVLRCNDCILYHLERCVKTGVTDAEMQEALSVALVVGGSVCIPHLRVAFDAWDRLRSETSKHGSEK